VIAVPVRDRPAMNWQTPPKGIASASTTGVDVAGMIPVLMTESSSVVNPNPANPSGAGPANSDWAYAGAATTGA